MEEMKSSLVHRGPDSNGVWVSPDKKVYLGHTRLAILDLTKAGNQPMTSSCGSYTIVFNGEIYNYLKIRNILKCSDHKAKWKGASDTETLVESIAFLGLEKTLKLLRGMYAFAVYNHKKNKIYLVRDRFGEKPLYFLQDENSIVAFASEVSAIEKMTEFPKQIDFSSASFFFQKGYIPAPFSIWKNVRKLLAGSYLELSLDGFGRYLITKEKYYWDVKNIALQGQRNIFSEDINNARIRLEHLLEETLEGQSLADVPLGVFLSGGIDSSLVAALLSKTSSKRIKTFCIGFEEKDFDESVHAERVAKHLKTDHQTLKASPNDALDLVEAMPEIYSEPFADYAKYQQHFLQCL